MPASPVADQDGVRRLGNLRADFLQVQVHRLGIGVRHDHRGADAARRADRAEQVGGGMAVVVHHQWP